jgi:cold shock CspA family protein
MKAGKKRGKWEVVLEWSDRVTPNLLKETGFEFDGKRGMSDREIWYIGRSRALYELEQFDQARQLAQKGLIEFPEELFLARTAALALAGSGDVGGGAAELFPLLNHPKADAYLKADLGELEFQLGNLKEAHRLLCEAVLNPQSEQYKLGYFVTMARISLAEQQPVSAAESIALAIAIRQKEDWSIPAELSRVEKDTREMLSAQGLDWPDLPQDPRALSILCMQHWRTESTSGLKRVTGRIGRINPEKKHTFIHRDDGEKPVFTLRRDLPKNCDEGDKVEFALKPSFDRKKNEASVQAVDIRVIK